MPRKLIRKLQTGFGISLLILITSSAASFFSIKNQIRARENILRTQQVILSANQILIDLQNAETGQRGFLLTNNELFLEPYHHSLQALPQSLKEAGELVKRNELQSARIDSVSSLVHMRLNILTDLANIKKRGENITSEQLEAGKAYMDSCRNIITRFIRTENLQLQDQSEEVSSITGYTSLFIIAAAVFSLVIIFIFYLRIRGELKRREKLQEAVRRKDAELVQQLSAIRAIAKRISSGNYSVRITDEEKDELGDIGSALNEMNMNLEKSFERINQNEWRQAGLARLNDTLVGNRSPEIVANDALSHLVSYGQNANGAIYLAENEQLVLYGWYGLENHMKKQFASGEGTVGQVFVNKRTTLWENIDSNDYIVSFSAGQLRVSHVLWLPLLLKDTCFGVIELGSTRSFKQHEIEFYDEACRIITLGIAAANSWKNAQTLLEETQAQSEELLVQHSELEKLNTELEAQTKRLQASEEELKVQQEELLQSNQELEEHSKLLEEKNALIAHRNLEIQKTASELALTTRYKSEFLANMSHELRTPLNSILLLSRLMAENTEKNLSPEQVKSAQVIQSSGTSLLSLIDEILDLSKIEAGKMELEYKPVNIAGLCRDLKDMFALTIAQKGLSFDIRIDAGLPESIETDQLRLEQVLRNLLANAVKFTAKGGITLHISGNPDHKDFVLFWVRDTGIGISGENQQVIFEAFQQADGSTRRKYGGTGLGLSICREIARLLGGKIFVQSELGEGSTFTVSIPVDRATADRARLEHKDVEEKFLRAVPAAAELQDEENTAPELLSIPEEIKNDRDITRQGPLSQDPENVLPVEEKGKSGRLGSLQEVLKDKTVLMADDDARNIFSVTKMLEMYQMKVIPATDGKEALEKLRAHSSVAVVLMDIMMPEMDGYKTIRQIRSLPIYARLPIIAVTAKAMTGDREKCIQAGASDYISKPVDKDQLLSLLRVWLYEP